MTPPTTEAIAVYAVHRYTENPNSPGKPTTALPPVPMHPPTDPRGEIMTCKQCGKPMNPVEAMVSGKHGVCGQCGCTADGR